MKTIFCKYRMLPLAVVLMPVSCKKIDLPYNLQLKEGDHGKAWLADKDKNIILDNVRGIFLFKGNVVVIETRKLRESEPFGYGNCKYFLLKKVPPYVEHFNGKYLQALGRVEKRRSVSSRSCIGMT